jgi:hypothetical protein
MSNQGGVFLRLGLVFDVQFVVGTVAHFHKDELFLVVTYLMWTEGGGGGGHDVGGYEYIREFVSVEEVSNPVW